MNYWDQLRAYLQARVPAQSYENWLRNARFHALDGRTLVILVPDGETRQWLETEYTALVRTAILELRLPVDRILYLSKATPDGPLSPFTENGHEPDSPVNLLNPKFTFES